MRRSIPAREKRTPERLRAHYEFEKQLAGELMAADRQQRLGLYTQIYDRLYAEIYDHPTPANASAADTRRSAGRRLRINRRFLHHDSIYLEIGPGSCTLLNMTASIVARAYGVDVSVEPSKSATLAKNAEVIISDGSSVPLESNSVDFAFSDQLMEHLHPEDAAIQLHEILRVLRKGAAYYCVTPNRLTGPHDISWHYDEEATGLHLKEYTLADIRRLFLDSGFAKVRYVWAIGGRYLGTYPLLPFAALEHVVQLLPASARRILRNVPLTNRLINAFLNVSVVGLK